MSPTVQADHDYTPENLRPAPTEMKQPAERVNPLRRLSASTSASQRLKC
jgi:hypothetical protein